MEKESTKTRTDYKISYQAFELELQLEFKFYGIELQLVGLKLQP